MKTITLRQPFASLAAIGVKTIETRSWSTRYRGRLVIHAAKQQPEHSHQVGDWRSYRYYALDGRSVPDAPQARMYRRDVGWATRPELPVMLPLGAIVATCELVNVVPITRLDDDAGHTEDRVIDMPLFRGLHLLRNHEDAVIEDQRPYGDFRPGRFAWLLSDIKPTTERCPLCWGTGTYPPMMRQVCALCRGKRSCDPVPAKGRHGLWEWSP